MRAESGSGAEASTPAPLPVRRPHWRRVLAAVALGAGGVLLALGWALGTESGLRALARATEAASGGALRIDGASGRVFGSVRIATLRYAAPGLALEVDDFALDWRPSALLDGRLDIDRLAAARVAVAREAAADDTAPAAAPADLRLPLAVRVGELALARFELRAPGEAAEAPQFAFSELRAALASDGAAHRLERLAVALPFGALELSAELAGASPFALRAQAALSGELRGEAYRLALDADGTLLEPRLEMRARGAGVEGRAELLAAPFDAVALRRLQVTAGDIDPSAFAAAAPHAALRIAATVDGEAAADGGLRLRGPLRIDNHAPAALDLGGLPVERLAAVVDWSAGPGGGALALALTDLNLALPGGGQLGGRLDWRAQPGPWGQLAAALRLDGVDLARLDTRLPAQTLAGTLDASAEDTRQRATIALRSAAARLEANAEVALAGEARSFTTTATLRGFDPRSVHAAAPRARLNLDLSASGRLGEALALDARFAVPDSRLEGRPLRGEGRLRVEGERLPVVELALELAGNTARARGAWGAAGDRLDIAVDAPALAAIGYGLGGRAGLEGRIGGSARAPEGQLRVYASALRLPGGVRVAGANGEARLEAGIDGPFQLALGVSGVGRIGDAEDWVDVARLSAEGRRNAHTLHLVAEGLDGDRIDLALDGGIELAGEAPPRWRGRLTQLATAGRLALGLEAPAALELAADDFRLGAAELDAGAQGRIRLAETRWSPADSVLRGSLSGLAFGLQTRADGRPRRGPGPLVLGAEWDLRLGDTVEGEARLFREAGDLTVEGEIRTRLGLEHFETRLVARGSRLALALAARGSELGEASGAVTAQAERTAGGWRLAPDAPLLGSARVDMPSIAWLGRLMRDNVDTGGRLVADFAVAGTPAAPRASGRITGSDLALALTDQGLVLGGGELVADFDRDRLRLQRLVFVSPNRVRPRDGRVPYAALTATPGRLEARGEIALDSGAGRFDFRAERLPLLQREDRWLILSGAGTAASTWTTLDLDAGFGVDAGYIEMAESAPPSLSDDVVVLGRDQPAGEGGMAVRAQLRIGLGEALYLNAMGVDTRLAGELTLSLAPGRALAAVGSISTVGGSYRGYGQRLVIDRGLINFQGELDNPGLNVVALRKGLAVEAGVVITGSARRPQVRLVSEPSVPDPEKLSWIVLGRAPDAGAGADLALLLPAAQALLGGPGGGMTEQLSRSLGFDSFSIGQGELNSAGRTATSRVAGGGSTISRDPTVAGEVLSVGKRLSADLFLSFEQSLAGAESLVKLSYQLGRRVSVVARGGTDNAVDIYYTFSFR